MGTCSLIYADPHSPNAESSFEECSISNLFQLKTIISRHLYCDRRKMSRRLSFDEESPITLFFDKKRRLMNYTAASLQGILTNLYDIFPESCHPRIFLSGAS